MSRLSFGWLVLLWPLVAAPARAADSLTAGAPPLTAALDRILDSPGLKGGIVGAEVARVSDGRVLYARNADTRLMPASNRKLFTAAAALELLGDGYTLKTDARAAARPDAQGVLHGDIVLRGGGDGLLSVADLDAMAGQVARTGVRRVTGGVCGDGTLFGGDPYGEGWEWDDLSDDYAPQITALEVNEGVVTAHVTAGAREGDPATVTEDPPVGYLPVAGTATTAGKNAAADVQIARPFDAPYLTVGGTLPLGGSASGTATVADPARFAAVVFRQALIRNGVAVDGPAFSALVPTDSTRNGGGGDVLLASHASLPLAQYLAKMDKPSDNLLAESLWRLLGAVKGRAGTYAGGADVAAPFLRGLGLDMDTLTLADGSGVSRRNFVTTQSLVRLLLAMHGKADWRAFYDSLPIAGVDGTLRRRMIGTPAAGNVHAKTGSLTGDSSLSGYVTGRDGTLYVFSLLMNNFPGSSAAAHAAQDAFAEWLAGNP